MEKCICGYSIKMAEQDLSNPSYPTGYSEPDMIDWLFLTHTRNCLEVKEINNDRKERNIHNG